MIKTENDKLYHFPTHSGGKAQILSDTKLQTPQMFDVRNADGQIVHVNIEDINQFLTYHEVFGKISGSDHFPSTSSSLVPPLNASNSSLTSQISHTMGSNQMSSTPLIIPKIENIASNLMMDGNQSNSTSSSVVGVPTPAASTSASVTAVSTNSNVNISAGTSATTNSIINSTAATLVGGIAVTDDASAMPAPSMHTCDICGKVFPFKYQFIVHRRYHNERKPFICQVCGQAFTTSVELTHHGKGHENNKMFTCNICYNVFANDASLERHMKRHSTDKPFGCTVCQKTFARKEHLDNHFRSHTGETPFRYDLTIFFVVFFRRFFFSLFNVFLFWLLSRFYSCQYCAKTFTRKEHMQNHVRK